MFIRNHSRLGHQRAYLDVPAGVNIGVADGVRLLSLVEVNNAVEDIPRRHSVSVAVFVMSRLPLEVLPADSEITRQRVMQGRPCYTSMYICHWVPVQGLTGWIRLRLSDDSMPNQGEKKAPPLLGLSSTFHLASACVMRPWRVVRIAKLNNAKPSDNAYFASWGDAFRVTKPSLSRILSQRHGAQCLNGAGSARSVQSSVME